MVTAIHAMKNIIVGRQPYRSWQIAFRTRPASCPTTAEFESPDCHSAGINF